MFEPKKRIIEYCTNLSEIVSFRVRLYVLFERKKIKDFLHFDQTTIFTILERNTYFVKGIVLEKKRVRERERMR